MIDNNTKTVLAMDKIYYEDPSDWEEYLFESTEYAMQLDNRNPVLEGIINQLTRIIPDSKFEDKKDIVKELNRRYIEMGVVEGIPKSVKNWLSGTPINPSYRENLYNLCLSLEMSLEETQVFFLKNYMTIPFNYKNQVDAIYYYAWSHNKKYTYIVKMLEKVKRPSFSDYAKDEKTANICRDISSIDDDDVFENFLKYHVYSADKQFQTAKEYIDELSLRNAKLANIERTLKYTLQKNKEGENGDFLDEVKLLREKENGEMQVNFKALLFVIYGLEDQTRYRDKQTSISKCETLPKVFRTNFPNDQEFSRIGKRTASPEVYRKALIIMQFYNFFCLGMIRQVFGEDNLDLVKQKHTSFVKYLKYLERDTEEIEEDFEDFYYETSDILAKCGFVQLYARNPFDWLIMYCAKSTDPMDTLRELLNVRWADYEEE